MAQENEVEGDEINLWQVVEFFREHVRLLLMGALAASVVALGGWFVLAPWKGEQTLIVEKTSGIDYIAWRSLVQNLPLLAQQGVDQNTLQDPVRREGLKRLAQPLWWQKNVMPNFALTKADTRSLFAVSKELQESSADTILSISVTEQASQQDEVSYELNLAVDFIREGVAYLATKSLLLEYQVALAQVESNRRQILENEIELQYLRARVVKIESLRTRFPLSKGSISTQQVLEIKDSNAKYMPVESQLIATYSDIDRLEEQNLRLRQTLEQLELKNRFLAAAQPLLDAEMNGLKLVERLLAIPLEVKVKSAKSENHVIVMAQQIKQDLAHIQSRVTLGLVKAPMLPLTRASPWIPLVGGGLGGFFLMLLGLMLRQGWRRSRAGG